MFDQLMALMYKPELYEKGTAKLWNDEHISKGMLEAHLNPDWDSATRKHSFVRESVNWIAKAAPAEKYRALLDLGCGPGIYAEFFYETGYKVTGMDFSERSINYARDSAQKKDISNEYHLRDYLTMDFNARFDLVTLINYDFGVLSTQDRTRLLQKIYTALNPGGLFIFDVFTPLQYAENRKEYKHWSYSENDFFCTMPHINLESFYTYEKQNTYCTQHIAITELEIKCINIWEHTFTKKEMEKDLIDAGFTVKSIYGDIAGKEYIDDGKEMCFIAAKEEK